MHLRTTVAALLFVLPAAVAAQLPTRAIVVEIGGGLASAGPSGQGYTFTSDKRLGPFVQGSLLHTLSRHLAVGVEGDYWRRTVVNSTYILGVARGYLTSAGLFIKAGGGWGAGNFPDAAPRRGAITFGAGYDLTPNQNIGVSLIANWMNTIGGNSSNTRINVGNVEMAEAGLALSFR